MSPGALDAHFDPTTLKGAYVCGLGSELGKIYKAYRNRHDAKTFTIQWFSGDVSFGLTSSCFMDAPSKQELLKGITRQAAQLRAGLFPPLEGDQYGLWYRDSWEAIMAGLDTARIVRDRVCNVFVIDDDQEHQGWQESLAPASPSDGASPSRLSAGQVAPLCLKRDQVFDWINTAQDHPVPRSLEVLRSLEGNFVTIGRFNTRLARVKEIIFDRSLEVWRSLAIGRYHTRLARAKEIIFDEGGANLEFIVDIFPLASTPGRIEETTVCAKDFRNIGPQKAMPILERADLSMITHDLFEAAESAHKVVTQHRSDAALDVACSSIEQQPPSSSSGSEEPSRSEHSEGPPSPAGPSAADTLACRECLVPLSEPPQILPGWSAPCDDCCCGACGDRRVWDADFESFFCCNEHIGGGVTPLTPLATATPATAVAEPAQMAGGSSRPGAPSKAAPSGTKRQLRSSVPTTRSGKRRR